jgi:predicted DNA-binding transcriptional regulator AlpA
MSIGSYMITNENKDTYTISEFCKMHNMCKVTFYRLIAAGKAPKLIKLERKVLISKEAAAEWRKNMEK